MKRILAYGDSNTWGFDPVTWGSVPMTLERYPEDIRWTGLLQKALGKDALVLEEGLCGRTTALAERPLLMMKNVTEETVLWHCLRY